MNNLPLQIEPDPIINVTFEIRYLSKSINNGNLLKVFFQPFIDKYSNFFENKMGQAFGNPGVPENYLAQYFFQSDKFSVGIGLNALTINVIGKYPLWDGYFEEIKDVLSILKDVDIVEKIDRVGLRYINIFQGVK